MYTLWYQRMYAFILMYVQAQSEGLSFHSGQLLIISNRDLEPTSGFAKIPYGSTVIFIYDGQRYYNNFGRKENYHILFFILFYE